MPSQDFIELMTKLHKEKYNMLSKRMEYHGLDDSPSLTATVTLEKEGKQISIKSSEWDFIKYVIELRGVADMTTGEHKFTRVRDLDQYNADVEHLFDEDRSKIKKAADEIISGKFKFTYHPIKLIDEFLANKKNMKDKKFLPLKRDYHHILVFALLESKRTLKMQEKLISKHPGTKRFIDVAEELLRSFMLMRNAIKDYKLYRSFVNFDIDVLAKRISTQVKLIDDTIKEFIRRGSIDGDIAVPRMMNIYSRCMELSTPIINLLRIGLELRKGITSPHKQYSLGKNIAILKSAPDYGSLFSCLDEMIRHSDAHVSIDIMDGKVHIMDARDRKAKIVRTYEFEELVRMAQIMQEDLFPALISSLILHEMAVLDLLLVSLEYKHLLLALGNC